MRGESGGRGVMGTLHGCWAGAGSRIGEAPRPEDPHPNPLPRGEGGRAAAASRTLGVYKSLRRRRAGVPVRVAGDVARLLGPAATLTPTLSLKREGGRGAPPLIDGWGPASGLEFEGRVDRKTPHRIRPKTADSASPPGEGVEQRPDDHLASDTVASLGEGGRVARGRLVVMVGRGR